MKHWIAKNLIGLLEFNWRKVQYTSPYPMVEITVKLAGTNILLLRALFDGDKWDFEEYK